MIVINSAINWTKREARGVCLCAVCQTTETFFITHPGMKPHIIAGDIKAMAHKSGWAATEPDYCKEHHAP